MAHQRWGNSVSVEQVMHLKSGLRRAVRKRLGTLAPDAQHTQSQRVWDRLRALPLFEGSKHVAVYLSVPGEIDTRPIVEHILSQPGMVCYVPHTEEGEMKMLSVASLEDLNTFECHNNWGILEPPADSIKHRTEAAEGGKLDLILVPGLAFSRSGQRLGKGKGYYDRYIAHAERIAEQHNRPRPHLVGLGFTEQLEEDIPTLPHDRTLDLVLTPDDDDHEVPDS
jgi:5-formyltetrahydrofolate cyclo-ligase